MTTIHSNHEKNQLKNKLFASTKESNLINLRRVLSFQSIRQIEIIFVLFLVDFSANTKVCNYYLCFSYSHKGRNPTSFIIFSICQ